MTKRKRFKVVRGGIGPESSSIFVPDYWVVEDRWDGWLYEFCREKGFVPQGYHLAMCAEEFEHLTGHSLKPGTWAWFSLRWEDHQ